MLQRFPHMWDHECIELEGEQAKHVCMHLPVPAQNMVGAFQPGYSTREASALGEWPWRAGAAHADEAHDGQAIGGAGEALHDAPRAVHQPAAGIDVARQHHLRAFAQLQAPRRLRTPALSLASLLVTADTSPQVTSPLRGPRRFGNRSVPKDTKWVLVQPRVGTYKKG